VSDYFDLSRIVELQGLLGSDAETILASMLANMTGAIARVKAAMAAGELDRATQDAHRARNDALLLSAFVAKPIDPQRFSAVISSTPS
jgi:hypothetical protein